jgi:transposase InsO family protein
MTQVLAQEFPVQRVCQALDCPRSSHYYQSKRAPRGQDRDAAERPLRQAVRETAGQWPTYGYRRLGQQLRREGRALNHKRLRRLMRQMGILGKRVVRKRRTTDSTHSLPRFENLVAGLAVTRPDQVWVADITYLRLGGGFVYLAVIMDVFTRAIRGWHLSKSLDADLTLTALRRAMQDRLPDIHHSDQGVQYAAAAYVQLLQERGGLDGGGGRADRERVRGAADAHDQGGTRGLDRVPGPGRRAGPDRPFPRRRVQPQANPLALVLPDACGVRRAI